jgi:hypothetical protein
MRYNKKCAIKGAIKKNVIVIERYKMSEPMEIPEGGGGNCVKGDGEKGEKSVSSIHVPRSK